MPDMIPDGFMATVAQDMLNRMREADRHMIEMAGEDPDNLPTRYVEQPLSQSYLDEREAFTKDWHRMQERGLKFGYLERDHCYECGGPVIASTNTTVHVAEPNPDYDPDKPLPPLAQHIKDGGTVEYRFETWKPTRVGSDDE